MGQREGPLRVHAPDRDRDPDLHDRGDALILAAAVLAAVLAQDPTAGFLARHCAECHGDAKAKGDFRLDQLARDAAGRPEGARWRSVLEQLRSGAMPPKAKPRPPAAELQELLARVDAGLAAGDRERRATQGRVVLRRLNRAEYAATVRDLLGVRTDLRDLLAWDGTQDGFDNVGAGLHLSSFALERYLQAAEAALDVAIANAPAPPVLKKSWSFKTSHQTRTLEGQYLRTLEDGSVACFMSTHDAKMWVPEFWPSHRGTYRFRLTASAFQSGGKPVTFEVWNQTTGLLGYFDAPADVPTVFEFDVHVEPRMSLWILPYGLGSAAAKAPGKAAAWDGPGLRLHGVDVEGPRNDAWPPASHRRLFGELPQEPLPGRRDRLEVVSRDPAADAERILRDFLRRAWRRGVSDADLRPFLDIFRARLAEKDTFEQALRTGLGAILTSPGFLFLDEKPGRLGDLALASRLSYFLWSTMPDEELLGVAESGTLGTPEALRAQVERMLNSPRAAALTTNFLGQWLGLRDIDATEPNYYTYPEYDQMLKASMLREVELFFEEILRKDLSLANFAASDFSFLNGRLARHYGVPGPEGWAFQRTALPPDSRRGGVLTMAAVLKVTANGTLTSPVTRGVWVLDRLLGTPPPPPPANVTPLEPDIRGAKTLHEQLAKHRSDPSCASCHSRIDPPGFALESFDVIGGRRTYYRLSSWTRIAKPVKGVLYLQGQDVDCSSELPDGSRLRDVDDLKAALLKDKDQLARALARRLSTYATGGAPESVDQPEIEAIVARVRGKGYGLRTLVHEIVQSRMFREK